jgi:hypothetical protein
VTEARQRHAAWRRAVAAVSSATNSGAAGASAGRAYRRRAQCGAYQHGHRPVLALALATLAGCTPPVRSGVTVEAAPGTGTVVFHIQPSATSPLYGLAVEKCKGSDTMWQIGLGSDVTSSPVRIVYGVSPGGYSVRVAPRPLVPGCYRVIVSGPREARFRVRADGSVVAEDARK